MTDLLAPVGNLLAEQLVGLNTKIDNLTAARVTYTGGIVTALDHVNNTFAANILQPDSTTINVAGIGTSAQFLPAVGNVVTLALSGPQIIYLPYGVAAASIDTPQLSPTVSGNISTATSTAAAAATAANAAIYSGQNLVPDPSFENGFVTTYTAPFSLDVSGSNAHTGAKAVQAVANAGAQNMIVTPAAIPILQSHTYRLSGWRKTDAGYNGTSTNGKLKIVKQDGVTAVASAVWTNGTSYAQVQTTYTVPSDGSVSSLQVVIGTDHTAGTLWVDDLELVDITDANAAVTAAATKIITFIQSTAPTASETGDLWLDSSNGNKLFRWSGASWVAVQDAAISTALTNAATAQGTANTKIITFIQGTAPTASETGDLWMDTSNGNKLFRWSGAAWVSVQDTAIITAINAAATAQATANTKVLVFAQGTTPTAQEVGDIWFNTADGMKMYIWGPTATVTRVNQANNPSFEFDAAGTVSTVTGWTVTVSGSNGTVTRSIVTTGGVTNGTKAFKSSASSQAATLGVWHGIQQSEVAAPGDLFRVQATFQLATTGANFVPYIQLEWLNASNTVIGTVQNAAGSGTVTTNQLLSLTTTAAPALTASARITLCRRTAATTGSALATSDIVIDSVVFERNRDSAAPTTYFDGNTLASVNDSKWDNPGAQPNSTSTEWVPGVSGVNGWQLQQFRTGAMEPQSILGNNCIAYGSITAPLLEAVLVLAGTIVAGNPNADHAALMTDGLHLFRTITGEGVQEVGTMAVGAFGTLMQWVNSAGTLVAQVDESGFASFTDLNVDADPSFQGEALSVSLNRASGSGGPNTANPGAAHWYGYADGTVTNVDSNEIGLIEVPCWLDNSRMYMIWGEICWHPQGIPCSLFMRIRDGGTSAPLMTSPMVLYRQHTGVTTNYDGVSQSGGLWQPTTTGQHRLLLTAQAYVSGSGLAVTDVSGQPAIVVQDLGPARALNATINHATGSGGGSAPAPVQQYYVELSPSSMVSRRGDGSLRTDTTDIVQGWDPSGFNGDGYGYWGFTLPSITGSIDRIDFYVYTNLTYFNSGGTAIFNVLHSGTDTPESSFEGLKLFSDGPVAGYPKPGPKTITLPSGWYTRFLSSASPRAGFISVGNSDGTNEQYYCRFDGPSARLRIWYTQ